MQGSVLGVYGLGLYLPSVVRANDWWPNEIVSDWREKLSKSLPRSKEALKAATSPGAKATIEAMIDLANDPFQGSVERRILDSNMRSSDMEALAAKAALDNAGVRPPEIDLLLTYTMVPDYLTVNHAAIVHQKVGLRESCFSLQVDGICSSFLTQLFVASQFIATGKARRALLVQSSLGSRISRKEEPHSAWLADAASAVVVGPPIGNRGLLSYENRTDGKFHRAFMCGIPGSNWYEEGRVVAYSEDPRSSGEMMTRAAECARQVVGDALKLAEINERHVRFYASHQPSVWFRRVTQESAGLSHANSADTFPRLASIGACNIVSQLLRGEEMRQLQEDDVVALFSVSSGMTWSSAVLRWGYCGR